MDRKGRKITAVEIGSSAVKRIQVEVEKDTLLWSQAELIELWEKEEEAAKKEIVEAVTKILRDMPLRDGGEKVYVFNSPQSFVRELYLPKIPARELAQAVQLQLKKEIPFAMDEANVGYRVAEAARTEEGTRLHILASAVSQKILDERLALMKASGSESWEVVHTPFSLEKLAPFIGLEKGEVVALIDMGAALTELNIYEGFHLKFARKIQLGSREITHVLVDPETSERIGLSALTVQKADEIVRTRGLLGEHPSDKDYPGFQPVQFLSAARPILERLQNETVRSFNYFAEQFHGRNVGRVLLSGGGALLQGLREFLEKRLQVPVVPFHPEPSGPFQIAADVLAKGGQLARYHRLLVSLASWLEEKRGPAWSIGIQIPVGRVIQASVATALVLLVAVGVRLVALGAEVKIREKLWKSLAMPYDQAKKIKEVENEVIRQRARLNQFFVNEPYWEDVFKEVSNLLPEGFSLNILDYQGGTLVLAGVYYQQSPTDENLTKFLMELSKGVFRKAKLLSTKETSPGSGVFQFQISCKL